MSHLQVKILHRLVSVLTHVNCRNSILPGNFLLEEVPVLVYIEGLVFDVHLNADAVFVATLLVKLLLDCIDEVVEVPNLSNNFIAVGVFLHVQSRFGNVN